MPFVKVADSSDVPDGTGRIVVVGDRELALFNVDGEFHCIDNECPHSFGPLGEGYLEGDVVMCPWHAWEVNVRTGEVVFAPGICVRKFLCKVEDGAVLVDV